jgi:hypothetical protein
MPWSPTSKYKHPFAGMLPDSAFTNKASFSLVDQLAYTGNLVFRVFYLEHLKIFFSYSNI